MIESKSMKLYFNSFNQTIFKNAKAIEEIIAQDLSKSVGAAVTVQILSLQNMTLIARLPGIYLDDLEV